MRAPQLSAGAETDVIGWYDAYAAELLRHAQLALGDTAPAQDAVADTFLKAWVYVSSGRPVMRPRAFLHRVLHNIIIDEYRRHKSVSLDEMLERGAGPAVDDTDGLIARLDGRTALALIERLPPKYREVLELRYGRSLSLKEMAHACGQSRNTLGVRVHRGLHKLRVLYESARASSNTHYSPVP